MRENAEKMRERHARELVSLQEECLHENISEWREYHWAPGHIMGKVRVCEFCDKIMEKTWSEQESIFPIDQAHMDSIREEARK